MGRILCSEVLCPEGWGEELGTVQSCIMGNGNGGILPMDRMKNKVCIIHIFCVTFKALQFIRVHSYAF